MLSSALSNSWHEVYKIAGVTVLVGERLFHYIVEWEDKAEKVKAFFGRRKGDALMELTDILKYEAALPEFKAWLQASIALVEKIESIRAAQAVPVKAA